ncbi:hypothetical protein TREPR_3108 [Treponema primitia ZAS-2]|uniref:Uncharacterized protein n=1 Tax=Treponema primitia (strain ATCC BAA-887 / DSM 12427 / ZAS-2) TaxID=545694 RepID=F5YMK1_TREPZ|nr:hypothetical protein TREPR_3108 [Treponema primitia ZAS-2]
MFWIIYEEIITIFKGEPICLPSGGARAPGAKIYSPVIWSMQVIIWQYSHNKSYKSFTKM